MPLVRVPADNLSREALIGVVDAFVLREGTEYGAEEVPLATKRADVLAQIESGEVAIVFDPDTEEVDLVLARDLPTDVREP